MGAARLQCWGAAPGGCCRLQPPRHTPSSPPSHTCAYLRTALAQSTKQALFALERCSTPGGGSLKLTCHVHALPALPAPTRMVGLVPLPSANPRAPPRLVAATDGGQLLRLRTCTPVVEKTADVQVGAGARVCAGCWSTRLAPQASTRDQHPSPKKRCSHPSQQGAKVLALAASGGLVAASCAGGEVRLFSAATLEPLAVLPPPSMPAPTPPVACSLSADGATLVGSYGPGAAAARWDVRAPLRPALLDASLCACHR